MSPPRHQSLWGKSHCVCEQRELLIYRRLATSAIGLIASQTHTMIIRIRNRTATV